ncbi:MAG TPA: PEP/pyruvate-binding domain-containing protein [Roseiflexaceae bacterium]|jgi:pyruvate,water dikinase|nr:PEP/pyruvate-binding domain-containing protein [Roseiflexaceae bacterium]
MKVLWLGDIDSRDPAHVGGKVANLSQLAAEYRVPPGFCLPASVLDHASHGQFPSPLCRALADAYDALAAQSGHAMPPVAVRSSAADEDGSTDSFAGQHATYLNIRGMDALVDAVQRCWASARTAQALDYRRQRGLATENIRLAVLIQHLIVADVSAVAFSTNPVTGNRNEIVINANWGLGESIVGGLVTPDTYIADKLDLGRIKHQIAAKRRMTVAYGDGTREVDVPRSLCAKPALTVAQVRAIAHLAQSLEQRMGWPVDVECAYRADHLYLLQCRPITTLAMPAMALPHEQPVVRAA